MKPYKILLVILAFLITGSAYYLRDDNYAAIPFPGESMDEYSFGWVGLSLIQTGVPMGTSGIPGYENYDFRYINVDQVFKETAGGDPFVINAPWFDHPPVLGLVTGGYAYLKGARVFEDVLISFIRKPMVVIGAISVLLLFIYLFNVFGIKEALVGSLIYTVSPLAIIGSRTVQAENLLIPLFLGSLIAIYFYIEKQKAWLLWVAAIIAGFSVLVKLSGIAIILSCLFLLFYFSRGFKKSLPSLITLGVISTSFFLFFISYGMAYDSKLFIDILGSNQSRFYGIGAKAFYDLLTTTKITNLHYLTDGWFLGGWVAAISLFTIVSDKKKEFYILIPLVCYLVVFILFGSEAHGWYRYPFLPFLFAAVAYLCVKAFTNTRFLIPVFLTLLIPIGVNISKIISIEDFQTYSGSWKWTLAGLLILFLAINSRPTNSKIIKLILPVFVTSLIVISLTLSVEYFWLITPEYWRSSH